MDELNHIRDLLEHIRENTDWTVKNYDISGDAYASTVADITLEYDPDPVSVEDHKEREHKTVILQYIRREDEVNEDTLISEVDLDDENVAEIIDNLKQKGEIYEPEAGVLRAT